MNEILKDLRKETNSVKNRLQLIIYDSNKLLHLSEYPIIPNERCGPWYTPKYTESAYFKSTDGHTNEWRFSFRRLNMHLLPILAESDGIFLVDSTKRGKLLPDSLLKTVPIWCAVINFIMYENITDEDFELEFQDVPDLVTMKQDNWLITPTNVVSKNEHNQIVQRIPIFAEEVKRLSLFSKELLIASLGVRKLLIPKWKTPTDPKKSTESFYFDHTSKESPTKKPYFTISCISASNRQTKVSTEGISFEYIQGAGDDHELWATKEVCNGNLTAKFFWNHIYTSDTIAKNGYIHDYISENGLIEKMNGIEAALQGTALEWDISEVANTNIFFGVINTEMEYKDFELKYPTICNLVIFSTKYGITHSPTKTIPIHHYHIESTKKGSKQLREIYPQLAQTLQGNSPTMVVCETGTDISVGMVLILLCSHFDFNWNKGTVVVSKDVIKKHLSLLQEVRKVNPSRNTLQSVNSFLMKY